MRKIVRNVRGARLIEYGILIGMIINTLAIAAHILGGGIANTFAAIAAELFSGRFWR